ncbi:MAG: ROK family protein [Rhizobiales bacterium]|nr:ROK family protein [Hyphomicrobiales bacterium]
MPQPRRIGIDLGGTKISAIVLDETDTVLDHKRVPTPRNDYKAVLACITDLVDELEASHGAASVGIGMPGSISPASGRVQNANSTWMNGQDFQTDMEASLNRHLRLANDANCFALSEAVDGAASDATVVFGVILGTGCGGGLVVNKQALAGPHNIAGEWGHNPLPWPTSQEHPGPRCWCGRSGCMETWLSGSGLQRDHTDVTGQILSGEDIVAAAEAGDPGARSTLQRHLGRLARGLAHVVNLIDPGVIILGGGLSNLRYLYDKLPGAMRPHVFCETWSIDIRPPLHGDDSGVRGAARLWDGNT